MVQRMGSHKEEAAKMIINMVLVALRKNFKCLSLTSSGQTILKAYFINLACVLYLQGGAETSSNLWDRFVSEIMAHCVFRKKHMLFREQCCEKGPGGL